MNNLKFKRLYAKNFLPFGEEGIEVILENYKNVVTVSGTNYDSISLEDDSSVGSGKSSLIDMFVYPLYGKCVKSQGKPTHEDVMNNQAKKGLVTCVEVNDWRITRTRKPNTLKIEQLTESGWDDSQTTNITDTQKYITENIIGLSYEAFCSTCIFNDNNSTCFLEADSSQSKQIVENLFGLEVYKNLHEASKSIKRGLNEDIKNKAKSLEFISINLNQAQQRLSSQKQQEILWLTQKNNEIKNLKSKNISTSNEEYENALIVYEASRESLKDNIEKIKSLLKTKKDYTLESDYLSKTLEELDLKKKEYEESLLEVRLRESTIKERINFKFEQLEKLSSDTSSCTTCERPFSDKEEIEIIIGKIKDSASLLNKDLSDISKVKEDILGLMKVNNNDREINNNKISKLKIDLNKLDSDIGKIMLESENINKSKKPDIKDYKNIEEKEISSKIDSITNEVENFNPYKESIKSFEIELNNVINEKENIENDLENLKLEIKDIDFWIKSFSDSGIRKLILENILPSLNARTEYWLDVLTGGMYNVLFDSSMSPIIQKKPPIGRNLNYKLISGGQKRNINLAISQSMAHVSALNKGVMPEMVFLDEVATNLDSSCVKGVFSMIQELSKTRKVFITTHNKELQSLLEGSDNIHFNHKNGLTVLKK